MGIEHVRRVYEIPAGFLHADERLVLLVLAEQTNDGRLDWGHDRAQLMPAMGLDPDSYNDRKWLERRLRALTEAGYLKRRKQRKTEKGTWQRPMIKLEIGARKYAMEITEMIAHKMIVPTRRAGGDGRAKNLPDYEPDRPRDEGGRFIPGDSVGRPVRDSVGRPGGTEPVPSGDSVGRTTTTHDKTTTKTTTIDGSAVGDEARRLCNVPDHGYGPHVACPETMAVSAS